LSGFTLQRKNGLKSKNSFEREFSIQRISGYNEFFEGVLALPYIDSYLYLDLGLLEYVTKVHVHCCGVVMHDM
jgi:hypothetical protein